MSNHIRIIVLWRQNDFDLFRRRNEAIFYEFARRPEVKSALHVEPVSIPRLVQIVRNRHRTSDPAIRQAYALHLRKALTRQPICLDKRRQIYVTSLLSLYSGPISWLNRLNEALIRLQCRRINRAWKDGVNPVVVIAYPPAAYLEVATRAIESDLLVGDLVDDVAKRAASVEEVKWVNRGYEQIVPRSELMFATSPHMAEAYGHLAKIPIEFLPNGVDTSVFPCTASQRTFEENGRPRIGYVGVLNQEAGVPLIEHIVGALDDCDFFVVGAPSNESIRKFVRKMSDSHANFHFLGPRHFSKVASFMASCNVLINIKKPDHTTVGSDSMKLYEYLTTGKPIVSTPVSPALKFSNFIYIAETPAEFVDQLKRAITEHDSEVAEKRRQVARENAWSTRVDIMFKRIQARLGT